MFHTWVVPVCIYTCICTYDTCIYTYVCIYTYQSRHTLFNLSSPQLCVCASLYVSVRDITITRVFLLCIHISHVTRCSIFPRHNCVCASLYVSVRDITHECICYVYISVTSHVVKFCFSRRQRHQVQSYHGVHAKIPPQGSLFHGKWWGELGMHSSIALFVILPFVLFWFFFFSNMMTRTRCAPLLRCISFCFVFVRQKTYCTDMYLNMSAVFSKFAKLEPGTGWRRLIGSPKLQIIFHKRATKYRSLLRKITYKDKGSCESLPPCMHLSIALSCCISNLCICTPICLL